MRQNRSRKWILPLLISFVALFLAPTAGAQQACFSAAERARAEQTAKVYRTPDPGYDPVLGYNPTTGPRRGAPPVDDNGLARPLNCVANKDGNPGAGTTPKFHCSVTGVFDEEGNLIVTRSNPTSKDSRPTSETARSTASSCRRVSQKRSASSPTTSGSQTFVVPTARRA